MSQKLDNLLDCPMYHIADRKALLQRVYDALIADPDAVLDFRGGHRYTAEEIENWQARQSVADILATF